MKCDCHLCKRKDVKAYWIMDMKFCKDCFDAIVHGDIEKLQNN
jgi:hypothetical protein